MAVPATAPERKPQFKREQKILTEVPAKNRQCRPRAITQKGKATARTAIKPHGNVKQQEKAEHPPGSGPEATV